MMTAHAEPGAVDRSLFEPTPMLTSIIDFDREREAQRMKCEQFAHQVRLADARRRATEKDYIANQLLNQTDFIPNKVSPQQHLQDAGPINAGEVVFKTPALPNHSPYRLKYIKSPPQTNVNHHQPKLKTVGRSDTSSSVKSPLQNNDSMNVLSPQQQQIMQMRTTTGYPCIVPSNMQQQQTAYINQRRMNETQHAAFLSQQPSINNQSLPQHLRNMSVHPSQMSYDPTPNQFHMMQQMPSQMQAQMQARIQNIAPINNTCLTPHTSQMAPMQWNSNHQFSTNTYNMNCVNNGLAMNISYGSNSSIHLHQQQRSQQAQQQMHPTHLQNPYVNNPIANTNNPLECSNMTSGSAQFALHPNNRPINEMNTLNDNRNTTHSLEPQQLMHLRQQRRQQQNHQFVSTPPNSTGQQRLVMATSPNANSPVANGAYCAQPNTLPYMINNKDPRFSNDIVGTQLAVTNGNTGLKSDGTGNLMYNENNVPGIGCNDKMNANSKLNAFKLGSPNSTNNNNNVLNEWTQSEQNSRMKLESQNNSVPEPYNSESEYASDDINGLFSLTLIPIEGVSELEPGSRCWDQYFEDFTKCDFPQVNTHFSVTG